MTKTSDMTNMTKSENVTFVTDPKKHDKHDIPLRRDVMFVARGGSKEASPRPPPVRVDAVSPATALRARAQVTYESAERNRKRDANVIACVSAAKSFGRDCQCFGCRHTAKEHRPAHAYTERKAVEDADKLVALPDPADGLRRCQSRYCRAVLDDDDTYAHQKYCDTSCAAREQNTRQKEKARKARRPVIHHG